MSSLMINSKLLKPIDIVTGTEICMGYKEDGKWVYAKKISFGNLPNNSGKSVPHGITNFNFIKMEGIAYKNNDYFALPFTTPFDLNYNIQCSMLNTTIYILTRRDLSDMTGFVTIYYTKK